MEENDVMLVSDGSESVSGFDGRGVLSKDGSTIKLEDKVEDRHGEDVPMKLALKKEIGHLEQREQYLIYLRYELNIIRKRSLKNGDLAGSGVAAGKENSE